MVRLIISELAKRKGLNQSQLQIKAGVTPQLLNRYWNNHTSSVALEQLDKIARALDVKPGDLIVRDGEQVWELTREHVSYDSPIPQDTIDRVRNALERIAKALGVKPGELIEIAGEDKK